MLEQSAQRVELLKKQGKSNFDAKNDSQVFYARSLSLVYGERMILSKSLQIVTELPNSSEKSALFRILSLYGANLIMKNIAFFYQGGFMNGTQPSELIQQGILGLLPIIKNDAVALIDAIAPCDYIINSALGNSDGEVYKHLQAAVLNGPGVLERPSWWKEVLHRDNIKNKL